MPLIQTPSIAAVVEDQSPQLGGVLDCQNYDLSWDGGIQCVGLLGTSLKIGSGSTFVTIAPSSAVNIQQGGSTKARWTESGGYESGGDIKPLGASGFYNLGSSSLKWANVYTQDVTASGTLNSEGPIHVYNFGSAGDSNYERLEVKWDANEAKIDSTAAGTGTARAFDILYNGSRRFRGNSAFSFMYQANGTYLAFGTDQFKPQQDSTIELGATGSRWSTTYTDTITIGDGVDAVLTADADDTLALKNSTNAQAFNIYNTDDGAGNYERLEVKWDSNDAFIGTAKAGTGSSRTVSIGKDGVASLICDGAGGTRSRSFYPNATSTYGLGLDNLRWADVKTDSIKIGDGTGTYGSVLTDDADNVLALRKDTNAQAFNVYNTYTDASNYERLEVKWEDNGFGADRSVIETTAGGTGVGRTLALRAADNIIDFRSDVDYMMRIRKNFAIYCNEDVVPSNSSTHSNGTGSLRWSTTYTKGIATDVETFTAASDTLDALNNVCLCDCTSNAITLALPVPVAGLQFHIKKIDGTANTVSIEPDDPGPELIDGAIVQTLSSQYDSITVVSDGSNWFVI